MSLVTKKIYPTGVVTTQKKDYVISSTGTVATNGSYNIIDLIFDISQFKAADTCKLMLSLSSATVTNVGVGIDSSKIQKYIQVESNVKSYTATFGTLGVEKEIDSTGITYLINNNTLHVYIDARIFSYNGDDPSNMQNLCTINLVANLSNSYIEYNVTEPDITNLTVTGTSIDSDITVSWNQTDTNSWTLQAILNGNVVKSWSGTTTTSQLITAGQLTNSGDYTFKLIATYIASKEYSITSTLSKVMPTISSIEPNNINQNVDNDINISWVSTNQQSYRLEIDGTTYTGNTQKALRIPGGTLAQGTKTVKLTIYYTSSWGDVRSATLTVSFAGYGKPPLPILNIKSIYSTATPSLRWSSGGGQVAYRIIITSGIATIVDTEEVISANLYYTLITALSNNTDYVVKLKIKNQYNLWSDEAVGNFRTEFNVPVIPNITVTADSTGAIIINVSANIENDSTYKNTEIWRKKELGEWVRIAYNLNANVAYRDFYVASDTVYEYKARNIGQTGGISESDVVSTSTKVKGYTFYDVENRNNSISFKNDVTINPKFNVNESSNIFAGNEKPTTEQGPEGYYDCTISFKTTDRSLAAKLVNLKRTAKVLLFKDRRGHKYFGNIIGSIAFTEDTLGIITVSLQFIETNFLEKDVYAGENSGIKLIKWDGTWKFDGTHSYS